MLFYKTASQVPSILVKIDEKTKARSNDSAYGYAGNFAFA